MGIKGVGPFRFLRESELTAPAPGLGHFRRVLHFRKDGGDVSGDLEGEGGQSSHAPGRSIWVDGNPVFASAVIPQYSGLDISEADRAFHLENLSLAIEALEGDGVGALDYDLALGIGKVLH